MQNKLKLAFSNSCVMKSTRQYSLEWTIKKCINALSGLKQQSFSIRFWAIHSVIWKFFCYANLAGKPRRGLHLSVNCVLTTSRSRNKLWRDSQSNVNSSLTSFINPLMFSSLVLSQEIDSTKLMIANKLGKCYSLTRNQKSEQRKHSNELCNVHGNLK